MSRGDRNRVPGASIPFTAALVLQLVADGALSLDDSVDTWLPGRVPGEAGGAITIRDLLSQTSGLVDPPPELAGTFVVARPPGAFEFANANYNQLPKIVAAAISSTSGEAAVRPGASVEHANDLYAYAIALHAYKI